MNRSRRKFLLQLRGALLLSAAALAVAAPLPGGYAAFAEDDSHDGGSSGGSGSGTSVSPSQEDGSAASQTRDGALATSLKGQIAPIGEIEALTGRTVPGEIIDIKLYQDKAQYVYRVKVMRWDGTIYDVKIDAMNRKLISARPR